MDKSWMSKNRLTDEYKVGVESFMQFAMQNLPDDALMPCPCTKCGNLLRKKTNLVKLHLLSNGIDLTYHTWIWHGERSIPNYSMKHGGEFGNSVPSFMGDEPVDMVHAAYERTDDPSEFVNLLEDAEKPLYPGCIKFTKLSAIVKLYNLKAKHSWSDRSFTDLLTILGDMLPSPNELPLTVYDAKKSLVSLGMEYLYCLALFKGKGTITIILDEALFGHERILHVNLEDVEPFCRLKPISYTCIAIYIWLLFGKVKKLDKANKFRFVDPYNIGHVPSTKKDTKSINERMERRAQDLANRLVGTLSNQFVLVPCNVDEHWILTVIDPHKEEIGILDPFYSGIHDSTWKKVIEWALKMFNATMQRKGRKTLNWSIPKVPKQPDNSQCGFYVMRYMKDIIESANFERISSLQLLFNSKSYSSVEIDEVRREWADCVLQVI